MRRQSLDYVERSRSGPRLRRESVTPVTRRLGEGWRMLCEPIGRDEVSTAMSEFRPSNDVPPLDAAARCNSLRDRMLIGMMLITLVRTSEALAGDQASIANAHAGMGRALGGFGLALPPAPALMAPLDSLRAPPTVTDHRTFSATDFRPRKPTVFDSDPTVNSRSATPRCFGTPPSGSGCRSTDRMIGCDC